MAVLTTDTMEAEPLLDWADAARELISFLALFLSAGAIGFRFFAMRGRAIDSDRAFYDDAARRAAMLGLAGVIVRLVLLVTQLPQMAARAHTTAGAFVTSDASTAMQVSFIVIALVGYALASARVGPGWYFAAVGILGASLRSAFLGKWASLVNPVHALAAGLWIGTLFVLVTAGLSALLKHEPTRERRGAIAADMVNGFSPLALTMGGVVVLFGVITAWRHLHRLSNLWSTPYGYALIAKLVFVALVFALGAWNWRRQRPALGSSEAATSIRRSSLSELTFAAIVLVITAIVVSLPAPKA
jgi:putative copper export protein